MATAVAAASVLSLGLAGCGGGPETTPVVCDQELADAPFTVCLPAEAEPNEDLFGMQNARVGEYEVYLQVGDAQAGDPEQAAFAALSDMEDVIVRLTDASTAITVGDEGPINASGVDAAFQSLEIAFEQGDVDDVIGWGRAIVVGDRTGAVMVVRDYDQTESVTAEQVDEGRKLALSYLVTLMATTTE